MLRRTYREDDKVKHETLGNLSHLPPDLIDVIRRRLRGESLNPDGSWKIVRSFPHGHVVAVLGTLRKLGLESVLASRRCRQRDLVVAMVVSRILSPTSKLAAARALRDETATSSLSLELGLSDLDDEELYQALDWLLERQKRIETKLAKRHIKDGMLLLYDVSSSYDTGGCSGLVNFGFNRDGDNGYPQ
ncbi:MAG: IS1634 family transposase, partial [Planctomycetes bacterium]|nr:IS1634 family transposase [Planctomycetota bacterium]